MTLNPLGLCQRGLCACGSRGWWLQFAGPTGPAEPAGGARRGAGSPGAFGRAAGATCSAWQGTCQVAAQSLRDQPSALSSQRECGAGAARIANARGLRANLTRNCQGEEAHGGSGKATPSWAAPEHQSVSSRASFIPRHAFSNLWFTSNSSEGRSVFSILACPLNRAGLPCAAASLGLGILSAPGCLHRADVQ